MTSDKKEYFNLLLSKKTGNNYDTYIDLCQSMNIININNIHNIHNVDLYTISNKFINLFGLQVTNKEDELDSVGLKNRLLSVVYDFADFSQEDTWNKISGKGIIAKSHNNKEHFLLTPDSKSSFVLYKTNDDLLISPNNNQLKMVNVNAVNGKSINFHKIKSGNDIDDFNDILQECIYINQNIYHENKSSLTRKKDNFEF